MHNAQQTSIEAYHELQKLPEKRRAVYDVIEKLGEACNLDIAYELRWPINRITPRTNELVALGLVEEAKKAVTPRTGRKVIYWKIK